MKTIIQDTSYELVEKKSKFIADLFYVETIEDIEKILKNTKKKYHDAKHYCYAYSIMTQNGIINKMSDDGEPSGTAGAPMLNIINKNELVNVLIIVTRYFGGILLGTGGLVKAYTDSTLGAIQKAQIVSQELGYELEITIGYSELEKFNYYCNKNNILITKIDYDEKIKCKIEVTKKEKEILITLKEEMKLKIEEIKTLKEKNIRKNIEI